MQTAARQSPEIEYARAKIFVAEKAVSDAEAEAAGGWAAMAFDAALSAWAKSEEAERAAFGLPFAIRETAAKVSVAAKDVLMKLRRLMIMCVSRWYGLARHSFRHKTPYFKTQDKGFHLEHTLVF